MTICFSRESRSFWFRPEKEKTLDITYNSATLPGKVFQYLSFRTFVHWNFEKVWNERHDHLTSCWLGEKKNFCSRNKTNCSQSCERKRKWQCDRQCDAI